MGLGRNALGVRSRSVSSVSSWNGTGSVSALGISDAVSAMVPAAG